MFAVSHYRYFWILGLCYAAQDLGSFIISFRMWVSHCVLVLGCEVWGLKFEILHYKFSCSGFGICGFCFALQSFRVWALGLNLEGLGMDSFITSFCIYD